MPVLHHHSIAEVESNPNFIALENKWLKSWYQEKIINQYLDQNQNSDKKFSFLDGPITANNPMGVHHAWGRVYKDVWQRYKNMCGYKQRFQNGFDCQGLWVEVEVEKELGFKNKKEIETYGIGKFVNRCKERVLKYSKIQTEQSQRLGYFMDWDNSYFTMSDENNYAIWNFLKVCWEKGWIYQGQDAVPWCPRCETAISQHEILTEDYKDVVHKSIYLELPIVNRKRQYLLIWTTTPWTIPANVAVAVDKDLEYVLVEGQSGDLFWLAGDTVERVFPDSQKKIIKKVKGKDLVGLQYLAPFDQLPVVAKIAQKSIKTFHTVVATDQLILPISTEEGTGLVHLATGAGTEDYRLGLIRDLPIIPVINDRADYLEGLGFLSGQNAKKHPEVILDYLSSQEEKGENWIFNIVNHRHRYPACWRCKTELVWKISDIWNIAMDLPDKQDKRGLTLRQKMIEVAKKINWLPKFGLERELDWLTNMHDWLISKQNRYWGLALPIWICQDCGQYRIIGSYQELKSQAIFGWDKFKGHSPHRPYIDEVKIKCSCGGSMCRTLDVGNPWLDAGIVSFSTLKYNHDKEYWHQWFPADFITESFPGQFKNWFYSLIAMSTVLEDTPPVKNILGYATVVAENGQPMHKSSGNSIEFNEAADEIGVDVMRWMFVRNNPERNLPFGFHLAADVKRRFHLLLWNSYRFFANYANLESWQKTGKDSSSKSKLDLWIIDRLNQTIVKVTKNLDKFNAFVASEAIEKFVDDLSTWYIRRSRTRIGPTADNLEDKTTCYQTLFKVLVTLSKLLMPFTPYLAEEIFTNLTGEKSVNLTDWPKAEKLIDQSLLEKMLLVRRICEMGHAERKRVAMPVKQPLSDINLINLAKDLEGDKELIQIIKDELNVNQILFKKGEETTVELNTHLTPELIDQGKVREIIRSLQQARKEAGFRLDELIDASLPNWPEKYEAEIKKKTLIRKLIQGEEISLKKIK